jgi:hypothetical protein
MKDWAVISLSVEPEFRPQLEAAFSSGKRADEGYTVRIALDDNRFEKVLAVMKALGKRPWTARDRLSDVATEYILRYVREYDASDLAAAQYLELRPLVRCGGLRDGTRPAPIVIHYSEMPGHVDFGIATGVNWITVSDRVKVGLEKSDLQNVLFYETVLYAGPRDTRKTPWSKSGRKPWWELGSDRVMPRVSPSLKMRNKRGEPTDGSDRTSGCMREDGFYTHPELRYRREDVANLPRFDLARSWEPFGGGKLHDDDRAFICSQRFYQFCTAQGWKTNWVPVRIDE